MKTEEVKFVKQIFMRAYGTKNENVILEIFFLFFYCIIRNEKIETDNKESERIKSVAISVRIIMIENFKL